MRVREGRAADFEQAWRAAAVVAGRYPGAGPQTMLRDPNAPLCYTITADWASREDLTRYQDSGDREALSAVLEELRESAAKSLYEVVAQVPPAAPAAGPASVPAPAPAQAPVPGPSPVPKPVTTPEPVPAPKPVPVPVPTSAPTPVPTQEGPAPS
ncbi:antibiotic biosynthesis monooxygenase family protein [Actinacidiphila acididurans]|uniref:Antibiotic biosynthesis monooxygenase n=1 Tax=Actinacidiphila acididurans TaxID=2784346 RepID=A0ABS2TXX9_9ACTN|nr:antibiotic biosynthesis monooxygenase [Actinacidiphila acididurans]MBM9508200.1 antibiotic biosynthesis monooxygenase [Actinacidiphila acididurans]